MNTSSYLNSIDSTGSPGIGVRVLVIADSHMGIHLRGDGAPERRPRQIRRSLYEYGQSLKRMDPSRSEPIRADPSRSEPMEVRVAPSMGRHEVPAGAVVIILRMDLSRNTRVPVTQVAYHLRVPVEECPGWGLASGVRAIYHVILIRSHSRIPLEARPWSLSIIEYVSYFREGPRPVAPAPAPGQDLLDDPLGGNRLHHGRRPRFAGRGRRRAVSSKSDVKKFV